MVAHEFRCRGAHQIRCAPQRVLHFEGLRDGYVPESSAEALAVALRARPRTPLVKPIPGLALLDAAASTSDRQIAQYKANSTFDGHFVLYNEPAASLAFREFLRASVQP